MLSDHDAKPRPRNHNHPAKGSTTKVEPIRDLKAIKRIKKLYADKPRDLCLFTMGINTAYRAKELLSLTVGQVDHLQAGDRLDLKQTKNGQYRATTLNPTVITAIDNWLRHHPDPHAEAPLFRSTVTGQALRVSTVNNMVKQWCREVGLRGNYGSHSLRKTWGYHQRVHNGQPLPLLTAAYGHATQAQTLAYLCIQEEEIADLFAMEL